MSDNRPIEVTVAICTYNQAHYLPQLLDSVVNQKTNFRFEIIVDDDCSPDNTREILRDYEQRYPGLFNNLYRDQNVRATRNQYGIFRRSRGKYIATVDGDDWWAVDDKLQYQYDFMEAHPEYIAMYCNSWVEESLTEVKHHPRRNMTEPMVFSFKDFMNFHFFDRMPNSDDTMFFRNFFKTAPEEEVDVMYRAHDMECDQTLALIFYGKGDVYVDPYIVSHHRSIVRPDGDNYQSLQAKNDTKVADAYKYACQEEYIENVLHRKCTKFYKVRGMVFAEAFWTAMKTHQRSDWAEVTEIWNQRKKKWPLVWWSFYRGCGTAQRKVKKLLRR